MSMLTLCVLYTKVNNKTLIIPQVWIRYNYWVLKSQPLIIKEV